jgi:phosphohistidine swiveling domain-containing protein
MPNNQELVSVYKSSAPPLPTGIMASCYSLSMKKSVGEDTRFTKLYGIITDKNCDWHFFKHDIDNVASKVFNALLKKPALVAHCRKNYLRLMKKVLILVNPAGIENKCGKMSDEKILGLLARVAESYRQASYYAEPADFSLELLGQELVKRKFREFMAARKIMLSESEFENYCATVSVFTKASFTQRAELSLMATALTKGAGRKKAIFAHAKKFYWQYYDYYGPILTPDTIKEELRPYAKLSDAEIRGRIKNIGKAIVKNVAEQKKTLRKYPLTKELRNAFFMLREFGYLYSDLKKELTSKVKVGIGKILECLAQRRGVDPFLLHFATILELHDFMNGRGIKAATLLGRTKKSILVTLPEYPYYEFLNERDSDDLYKSIGGAEEGEIISQIKGVPACSGKYTGPVVIVVNASQIGRVKNGDVLVAAMTAVNYVPAMKKAGAIVTDIGGITSHAAIVSRELGTPCVVGTKIGTKVLHDGDIVEVNANHGLVKLIKKSGI